MEPTAELLTSPLYGTPKEPLDGIWLDDAWYWGGTSETVHRRNVVANPKVVMHLPDPARAVIVEGEVRITKAAGRACPAPRRGANEKGLWA